MINEQPKAARQANIPRYPTRALRMLVAWIGVFVVLASASQLYAQGMTASTHSLASRNATTRTNSAQATLQISAIIVRVAFAPQPTAQQSSSKDLFISLPSYQPEMEVTSELHTRPDNPGAELETTTIALR